MNLVITVLLLILGFILLVKGSDVFVDGSSSIARIMGIPSIIIGLTIVSMGTSAPEAAVSITAGLKGSNEIALSNLIGSNVFNMLCVAGFSALITPFLVDRILLKRDLPVCIFASVLATIFAVTGNIVSRLEGAVLLVIFVAYIAYLVMDAIKNRGQSEEETKVLSPVKSIIFIIIGLAAIIFGGQLVVNNAKVIAKMFGMSETLIGLTIVAIGTSLPEFVTSVVAARKGQSAIAIGNVVGSNIFNLTFILGMSTIFTPIAVINEAVIDGIIMIITAAAGYLCCLTAKKLNRAEGILFVLMYVIYTAYLILR